MLTQRKPTRSCLADIEHYFRQPPPLFLDLELAVCWVLDCLLKNDSYPSGLLQRLQSDHPKLRLSETVLHQAVDFLEQQEMLDCYTKRCPQQRAPTPHAASSPGRQGAGRTTDGTLGPLAA